jgi:hypothetical protein
MKVRKGIIYVTMKAIYPISRGLSTTIPVNSDATPLTCNRYFKIIIKIIEKIISPIIVKKLKTYLKIKAKINGR